MDKVSYKLYRTPEFDLWFYNQTTSTQDLILARLNRISLVGHFGTINYFDGMIELKWKSGLRVYLVRFKNQIIVVLGGGNKNGQSKDIRKAKILAQEIKDDYID